MTAHVEAGYFEVIAWWCDECDYPIKDGDGVLTINVRELGEASEARAKHERETPLQLSSVAAMVGRPARARWRIEHNKCGDEAREDWDIDVERIRTGWDLLAWTATVVRKGWINDSNWVELIWDLSRAAGSVQG